MTLTDSQASDLARHFLGREWMAITFADGSHVLHRGAAFIPFVATSWRDAFRAAGVRLPSRQLYVAIRDRVMFGSQLIQVAESKNHAALIARRLNRDLLRPSG